MMGQFDSSVEADGRATSHFTIQHYNTHLHCCKWECLVDTRKALRLHNQPRGTLIVKAGESVKVTVLLRSFFEGAELRVGTSSLADRQGCREPCEGRLSELDTHQSAQNQPGHRHRSEGEDRRLTRQYLRQHEQDRNRCESSDYDSA